MSYSYYGDRRLASAVGGGHSYYTYYDALGRCVIRQMDGVTTYYTYDGEKPIYEWKSDSSGAGWQLYGKGIDEILLRGDFAVQWPDGSYGHGYFYQQDHEGSVTHLMSFQGTKIESYRYDAFGQPTLGAHVGSLYNNRFKFTGREWVRTPDDSFQFRFYEYRNRAYHPGLGRFMSEDSKGFDAGDYNLYRYCGNNPVDRTDPMGLDPVDVAVDVDRAAILSALDNLRVSESNSDRRGVGRERMTVIARVNGVPKASEERSVGTPNERGGQTIHPPASLPKGSTASEPDAFPHNHTMPTQSQADGGKGKTFLSPQDRHGLADNEGKPVYVAVKDKDGNTVVERYRPSDRQELAQKHQGLDSATERLDAADVERARKELTDRANGGFSNTTPMWRPIGQ